MKNEVVNIELKEILKVLMKKYYIIIVMLVAMGCLGYYYGNLKSYTYYQTTSRLIIGNSLNGDDLSFNIKDIQIYQKYMNTYAFFFKTDSIAEETVRRLGMDISPTAVKNSVQAIPQENTQFIDVTFVWKNQNEGKQILDTLDKVFIEEVSKIYPTVNVKVMDKAKEPRRVLVDNKKKYMMVGGIAGVVLSILIIFAMDFMDNTIKDEEEVKKYLDKPVLSTVPKNKKMLNTINSRTMYKLDYRLVESYRTLRTNIDFSGIYKNVNTMAITSVKPGEGKSTTASMLAVYMALAGRKTVLVDCDLRKPVVKDLFGVENDMGLSNALLGNLKPAEVVKKCSIDNLYILTSGIKPPNPAEVLSSTKTREFIELLKREYEYVIIDTPPIGFMSDAQIISKYVDGTIMVVVSGKSDIKETIKAQNSVEQVDGRMLGIVINKYKDKAYYAGYKSYYGNKMSKKKVHIEA